MSKLTKLVPTSIRLPLEVDTWITEYAISKEISKSKVMRTIIQKVYDKNKRVMEERRYGESDS